MNEDGRREFERGMSDALRQRRGRARDRERERKGPVKGCGKGGKREVGNKTGRVEGKRERSKGFIWCEWEVARDGKTSVAKNVALRNDSANR